MNWKKAIIDENKLLADGLRLMIASIEQIL